MMPARFHGRFECVDIGGDVVSLHELPALDRRQWGPTPYELRFTQRQFDAVDFVPQIGMRFDMTYEFRPTGPRSGGAQEGIVHITGISNVTRRST